MNNSPNKQRHNKVRFQTPIKTITNKENEPAPVVPSQRPQKYGYHQLQKQPLQKTGFSKPLQAVSSWSPPKPKSVYDFPSATPIAAGAFATVLHAREQLSSMPAAYREVALKRINLDAIEDPAIKKITMNEVDQIKSLQHENIVECYYSFDEISPVSGTTYLVLVLEFINGGDLEGWIKNQTTVIYPYPRLLPEDKIWTIFGQITAAVTYIHSKNIIHRDLKPANVLMTQQGRVKLADFGLSKLIQMNLTQAKTVCGTPYYMSPERIIEMPYTYQSDVWSLGCILYEMAALRSPFFGEKNNVESLVQKIQQSEYPPLPQDCYSPQLERLITVCMCPEMDKRPSAKEINRVAVYMNTQYSLFEEPQTQSIHNP